MIEHMPEMVMKLSRRPGEKEARYTHLLSGPPAAAPEEEASASAPARPDRLGLLEAEVAQLRAELEDLKQKFAEFRIQFE
jgi:uncharacterized protein YceH (UPF0502 family)